jgi:hypothetical protein
MITHTALFKTDSPRRIDDVIDYFGEPRSIAVGRKTWLTRGPGLNPRPRRRDPASIFAMR